MLWHLFRIWADPAHWEWHGVEDGMIAPTALPRADDANAPERVFWEIGLAVAIPLILAAIAGLLLP